MQVLRGFGLVLMGAMIAGAVVAMVEAVAHGRLSGDALFAVVALGYGLGAGLGCLAASRLGGRWSCFAIAVVLAVLALVNLYSFAHPAWFAAVAALSLGLGGWLGYLLGRAWARRVRT